MAPQFESGTGLTTLFEGEWATVRRLRKGKLVVVGGADQGKEIEISKPRVTGGRSIISDLVVQDKAVSGTHFEVSARDDGYRLRDLNSRNGIYVGDLRVREVYLRPGTIFRIGHTNIQFQTLQDVVEIELSKKDRFDAMLGASPAMREIFAHLEKVAPSELTCLITGETGTGKEMVARALHNASGTQVQAVRRARLRLDPARADRVDAVRPREGQLHGRRQPARRLLRCRPTAARSSSTRSASSTSPCSPSCCACSSSARSSASAATSTHKVDVRVLAATNRDLREEVNKGTFREDLYFRLSVVHVELPPMRERREDIPGLANHFLREVASRRGMTMSWSQDAMAALMSHSLAGQRPRDAQRRRARGRAVGWPGDHARRPRVRPRDGPVGDGLARPRAGGRAGGPARGGPAVRHRAARSRPARRRSMPRCSRPASGSSRRSSRSSTRSRSRTSAR